MYPSTEVRMQCACKVARTHTASFTLRCSSLSSSTTGSNSLLTLLDTVSGTATLETAKAAKAASSAPARQLGSLSVFQERMIDIACAQTRCSAGSCVFSTASCRDMQESSRWQPVQSCMQQLMGCGQVHLPFLPLLELACWAFGGNMCVRARVLN